MKVLRSSILFVYKIYSIDGRFEKIMLTFRYGSVCLNLPKHIYMLSKLFENVKQ